jgi:Flp pilus assembly pilin Flp
MSSILQFIKEEEGAEIVEVGIWLALAVAASIAVIALIGPKILAGFTNLNAGLP